MTMSNSDFSIVGAVRDLYESIEEDFLRRHRSEKEERLCQIVYRHFDSQRHTHAQIWVLHHDYEWTVEQIAKWPLRSHLSGDELKRAEAKVLQELKRAENSRELYWGFENNANAERVCLDFHFMDFEQGHRAEALLKSNQIRKLCGERLFWDIATMLDWSEHQIIEIDQACKEQEAAQAQ